MFLVHLQNKLPDWIHLPASAAIPFGSFEAVLQDSRNAAVAAEMQQLQEKLQPGGEAQAETLAAVKRAVLCLEAPPQLLPQLQEAFQIAGEKHTREREIERKRERELGYCMFWQASSAHLNMQIGFRS